ncbi:HVO_0649 family zinc finger protein [Haloarcula pelagica]|uniref:HVO_0649 family zinc finger protein n=1 Tax=Haloarcula pelagica TaxID=3033389 RepID=UPI0024C43AED|nr:HVO_0649 family zinc finger protein [Halomicroarcula sp. YJ-61-S]
MATNRKGGSSPLARIQNRYEGTKKKCPECGFVDEAGNWDSRTNGGKIVYRHTCPSCDAEREHTFSILG